MGRVVYDLAQLPRIADGWTFLYTEKVRIERIDYAIELRDKTARVSVPVAALSVLLLGPGATITQSAVLALAESGCSIVWCGEGLCRFYAAGLGETRRSHHLQAQANAWANSKVHLEVVRRMYAMRFAEPLPDELTLEQIRGREGVRVRQAYAAMARETGVRWSGRSYRRDDWNSADSVNRALSAANACLYGICHAAIVSTGFSPGLGFIHTGKMLSFVYDIADLYKMDVTVPAAFRAVAQGTSSLESRVRALCRELFFEVRLLERIVPDIQATLGLTPQKARLHVHHGASDEVEDESAFDRQPGCLWNAEAPAIGGGQNFAARESTKPGVVRAMNREFQPGDANEDGLAYPRTAAGAEDDEVPF